MKTFFITLFAALLVICFFANSAIATSCPSGSVCITNPIKATTFEQLINSIIDFLWTFGLAVVPVVLIVAGYFFITSAGDPKKVSQAKMMVIYALIGLLIIGMAKGIILVIKNVFGTT